MSKKLIAIIAGIVCIVQVASFIFILNLKGEINELNQRLDQEKVVQNSNMSNIYTQFDQMKELNSMVESFDYQYGKINTKDLTIDLKSKVTLKEFGKETKVYILLGEKKISTKRDGESFKFDLAVPLNNYGEENYKICVENNGIEKVEKLDLHINTDKLLFSELNSEYVGYLGRKEDNHNKFKLNGDMYINMEQAYNLSENISIKSATFRILVSDKEVYAQPFNKDLKSVKVNKEFDVQDSDSIVLQVEFIDSWGLIHKINMDVYVNLAIQENTIYEEEKNLGGISKDVVTATEKGIVLEVGN